MPADDLIPQCAMLRDVSGYRVRKPLEMLFGQHNSGEVQANPVLPGLGITLFRGGGETAVFSAAMRNLVSYFAFLRSVEQPNAVQQADLQYLSQVFTRKPGPLPRSANFSASFFPFRGRFVFLDGLFGYDLARPLSVMACESYEQGDFEGCSFVGPMWDAKAMAGALSKGVASDLSEDKVVVLHGLPSPREISFFVACAGETVDEAVRNFRDYLPHYFELVRARHKACGGEAIWNYLSALMKRSNCSFSGCEAEASRALCMRVNRRIRVADEVPVGAVAYACYNDRHLLELYEEKGGDTLMRLPAAKEDNTLFDCMKAVAQHPAARRELTRSGQILSVASQFRLGYYA